MPPAPPDFPWVGMPLPANCLLSLVPAPAGVLPRSPPPNPYPSITAPDQDGAHCVFKKPSTYWMSSFPVCCEANPLCILGFRFSFYGSDHGG